jgi:hypothetical protein
VEQTCEPFAEHVGAPERIDERIPERSEVEERLVDVEDEDLRH